MKRHGQLMERIADPENLRLAFWKASKGKRGKADCRAFRERLDIELASLREDLLAGRVPVGRYHYFTIHDPKERVICAASFRERVLHHALMNVCEPILERAAIFDSYACRKGKGQLAAVHRASNYTREHRWFLKLDVRKYFDSVDHAVLKRLLARKFKDLILLGVFEAIIASYETSTGKGLPIGNLTSQHFANFYLSPLDRFHKQMLGRKAYVRYMDDFVVWGECREDLAEVWRKAAFFLESELKLALKPDFTLARTACGLEFLGYRLYPGVVRLARRSKVRFARKFRQYEAVHRCGRWSELQLQQRTQALFAFTLSAQSRAYRLSVMRRFGGAAIGLEPRETRRQLEQQRDQLPDSEPQQQQPEQQQQQSRVPLCPAPSSTWTLERVRTDPAALLSPTLCGSGQTGNHAPPGASRQAVSAEDSGRGGSDLRLWTRFPTFKP